jgi:crotonobetainyl-CoA:carnitine CoA-transferase CaiB-like acyl-CoA transferase
MPEQPFAGVTVLEFGQFVAVPFCAQLLADGGAHVVKVEPHEGDPTRSLQPLAPGETRHFISRNRGKHTLPVDLRHPGAGRVLDALFARADIALLNLRPGLAEALGLDHATLAARYPRLITGNVTAFGRRGPDAMLPGMDLVVQARSGLMAANGKLVDGLPMSGDTPIADYMAAALLALGVTTALYERERTGKGSEIAVSLLGAALVLQNNLFLRIDRLDRERHASLLAWLAEARAAGMSFADQLAGLPGMRTASMPALYYRTYVTKDGHLAVACASPGLQRRFCAAIGLEDAALDGRVAPADIGAHYRALRPRAEAILATKTSDEWRAIFDAHGTPASRVYMPIELFEDEQVLANGLLRDLEHRVLGTIRLTGSPIEYNDGGFEPAPLAAPFASETRDILAWAGLDEAAIDEAIASGVVLHRSAEA